MMELSDRRAFTIAAINPFWRYAVGLTERPDIPAVPYRSLDTALAMYDEACAEFPDRTPFVLRRVPWRPWRRRVVEVYRP